MVNVVTSLAAGVGVAATAYGLYSAYWWYEVAHLEKPKYTVTKSLKSSKTLLGTRSIVELRHYEPYLIAEATVTNAPMRTAMRNGFMKVAKFIFGKEQVSKEKPETIAMTSPVRMSMPDTQPQQLVKGTEPYKPPTTDEAAPLTDADEDTTYKISFVMPRKYTKESLQALVPDSSDLNITEVPAHDLVAISFNGPSPTPQVIENKRLELLAVMKENEITREGDVMVYQYHPPFAPNFVRVNEVLYMVKH